jgi:hypothetical protein
LDLESFKEESGGGNENINSTDIPILIEEHIEYIDKE